MKFALSTICVFHCHVGILLQVSGTEVRHQTVAKDAVVE